MPEHRRTIGRGQPLVRIDRWLRVAVAGLAALVVLGIAVTQLVASWQTIAPEPAVAATSTSVRATETATAQAAVPTPATSTAQSAAPAPTKPSPVDTATPVPEATRGAPTSTPVVQASPTTAPGPTKHVVARGDTLLGIANRYNVTVDAVMRANGLINPDQLSIGQVLIVPPPLR